MTNKQRTRRDFLKTAGTIVGATAGLGAAATEADAYDHGLTFTPSVSTLTDWQEFIQYEVYREFDRRLNSVALGLFRDRVLNETDERVVHMLRYRNAFDLHPSHLDRRDILQSAVGTAMDKIFAKMSLDSWQVIVGAGSYNRSIVTDDTAGTNYDHGTHELSTALLGNMQKRMKDENRTLTDIFVSPELFDKFVGQYNMDMVLIVSHAATIARDCYVDRDAYVSTVTGIDGHINVCKYEKDKTQRIVIHSHWGLSVNQCLHKFLVESPNSGGLGLSMPENRQEYIIGIDNNRSDQNTHESWAIRSLCYVGNNKRKMYSIDFGQDPAASMQCVQLTTHAHPMVTDATHVLLGAV